MSFKSAPVVILYTSITDEYNNKDFKNELLRLHNNERGQLNLDYLTLEDDEVSSNIYNQFLV